MKGKRGHAQAAELEEPTTCATKRRRQNVRRRVRRSVDDKMCDKVWDEVWELDVIPDRL